MAQITMIPADAIREACRRLGGQDYLAAAMGISQARVSQWIKENRVPAKHVLRMEMLTSVERHLLNPVIYPPPIIVDLSAIEPEPTATESVP